MLRKRGRIKGIAPECGAIRDDNVPNSQKDTQISRLTYFECLVMTGGEKSKADA